jgi:SMI1 / KNR4 family (SUKH-1)
MDIETVARELDEVGHELSGGVEDAAIDVAASQLRLPLPPGYRAFLRRFGSGYVSFESFIGLGGPPHLDVVKATNKLRQPSRTSAFPDALIPILPDGGGNYDCIDTSQPTGEGEFRIVFWQHDRGDGICETVADSYLGWLWEILQAIRRDGDGG